MLVNRLSCPRISACSDHTWIFCALAQSAGRMAYRASYRSEEIGQEEARKRNLNQSIPLLLCLMFRSLQKVETMNKFRLPEAFLVALKAVNIDPPFLFRKSGLPPTLCSSGNGMISTEQTSDYGTLWER
jgi:hypothetical protein